MNFSACRCVCVCVGDGCSKSAIMGSKSRQPGKITSSPLSSHAAVQKKKCRHELIYHYYTLILDAANARCLAKGQNTS